VIMGASMPSIGSVYRPAKCPYSKGGVKRA
jgi:hypothetical protein